jgi:DNA polymerase-4
VGRVILHCDLNSFYASVECLYNPDIRDKPVAVCGSQSTRHGIVLAKNIKAKEYGVKTGEPVHEAKSKCPGLVVVPPNYSLYLRFSKLAMDIYRNYTNLVEPFGIDECWLDVTESINLFGSGKTLAYIIKERIKEELGITISAGVSFNKIFAKLGSDIKKPDAVTVIGEGDFKSIVWPLPAENLIYVGRSTKKRLNRVGICTIGDLANSPRDFLVRILGKWGDTLWAFANGYDAAPVASAGCESIVKGVGNSLTTPRDLCCNEDVKILIYVLSDSVAQRLRRHNLKGKTVQLSIRDSGLSYMERQGQLGFYTFTSSEISKKAYEIFLSSWNWSSRIRLIGVRVTDLVPADKYIQLSMFADDRKTKRELIERSMDRIRERFGHYSVQRALLLKDSGLNENPAEENIIHPVSYFR